MNDTDFSQGINGVPKGVNVRPNSRNKGKNCSITPSEHEEESDSNTRNNFSAPPINFNNSAKHHVKGKGKSQHRYSSAGGKGPATNNFANSTALNNMLARTSHQAANILPSQSESCALIGNGANNSKFENITINLNVPVSTQQAD